jgi:NADH-ubiquinone oxidoreductase chain 5
MSGIVAVFEYDLKKIIALSTLSQLGIIIFSISLGLYRIAFFHLITHALFKALLFLCAGIFIHGVGGSQDIRMYGGLAINYPLVGVCLNLANFSLCGIPFMSGFYSKDLIVELACQRSWNLFIILIIFLSLGFTVIYSTRLVFRSFVNIPGGNPLRIICDIDNILVFPALLLTFMALFSGPTLL